MTAETRPPTGQDGSPPSQITAVHEVQPPEPEHISFKEMEYRWPGEWIAATVVPNRPRTPIYQAPGYVPDPKIEEPTDGIVLVHSKNEDDLKESLTRENAPVRVFKSEEVNKTQKERDLYIAGELRMVLKSIPRRYRDLLRGDVYDKEEKRWKNGTDEAMKGINGIIEPHMDWANAVIADPEKYWGYDWHFATGDDVDKSRTRKEHQFSRERWHKLRPAAEVSAIAGYNMGLRFLAAELVVSDLNPQWALANLLGNLTDEQVGRKQHWFAPKDLVMDWVAKIDNGEVVYLPKLDELMKVHNTLASAFWNLRRPRIKSSDTQPQ